MLYQRLQFNVVVPPSDARPYGDATIRQQRTARRPNFHVFTFASRQFSGVITGCALQAEPVHWNGSKRKLP